MKDLMREQTASGPDGGRPGKHSLQEGYHFLQALINTIPHPIFYKDPKGLYLGCNKAFEEFLGVERDGIIGKAVYDIAPGELARIYDEADRALFRKPGVQIYESKVAYADGTVRDVIFYKATFLDQAGKVSGLVGSILDITERKRLEEELARSEGQLRIILDTAPECVKLVDSDGRLIHMNSAGLAMVEADSLDQVAGKNISLLAAPEYVGELDKLTAQAFRGESGTLEFEMIGLKGARRWMETRTVPLRNSRGEIIAMLGVTRDISERREAGETIRRDYEARSALNRILQMFLEEVPIDQVLERTLDIILSLSWLAFESRGCIFLVENGDLVMKAEKEMSPAIREECGRVPFGKCLCGRAASERKIEFSDCVDDRHEIRYEGITPHGHYCVPILFAGETLGVINLYIREGHVRTEKEEEFLSSIANALAGILQRSGVEEERKKLISKLRQTLNKIGQSQKEWRETFDGITDLISIHDDQFRIIKANKAFAEHYGFHPREIVNKKCLDLFHEGMASSDCEHSAEVRENRTVDSETTDPNTGRIFNVKTFPYHSNDGRKIGSIRIARDITEQREQEMRLIMSERLASLGQMASGIAHEINNPLASILGCAEALLSRVRKEKYDPVLFERYLGIIQEEIRRCKSITTGMLSIVRKASYERKEIRLNDLLARTLEIIGFQGRLRNVDVRKDFDPEVPPIQGSEGELRQVFMAVISNSLDAMEDAGTLTVETGAGDGSIFVRISDSGPGISGENIGRIFDPFFTTKSDRGGTGLGLSVAHKIISNHNGTIRAYSEKGKGASFVITLPLEN